MSVSLNTSLAIASSGLLAINKQFAIISQNVSNANSADYTNETTSLQAVTAGGVGSGVRSNNATLSVDTQVQQQVFAQGASVSYSDTTANALATVDGVMGTPGAGTDLPSMLTDVENGFTSLAANPSSQTQMQAVVTSAQNLTSQINTISTSIQTARQNAQNDLQSTIKTANTNLQTISSLNQQIISLQQQGQSTADLENQRAAAEESLSSAIGANFVTQADGSVLAFTSNGTQLPTDGSAPLSVANASVTASTYYPGGGLPGVELNGTDITSSITSGEAGADLNLRDNSLPTLQAGLDEFSQNLASQFSAQGLTLFTDPNGNVPSQSTTGNVQQNYVGFAQNITVNPAVVANPSLVRDGTNAVAGSPGGASAFTPNTSGESGFTTLINRVLTYALGDEAQNGVPQPASNTTGLGPSGTISLSYDSQGSLAATASAFVGSEADLSSEAQNNATNATSLQSALQTTLSQTAGVDVDAQMSKLVALQNAYDANAKVITTLQSMFQVLENI